MNYQDIAVRALKTFAQAFLAANVLSLGDVTITLLDTGVAAGLAAVASLVQNLLLGVVNSGE